VPVAGLDSAIPKSLQRQTVPALPEVSELDLVRHFTHLSQRNMGIDTNFYPLGSCTMKYNPKINEDVAAMPGFRDLHPYAPESLAQGALEVLYDLEHWLAEISGMDAISLQPTAGSQGELTALFVCRAYHAKRGRNPHIVLVPDTSHGTNPASAALCGYQVETVKSDNNGHVDLADLKAKLTPDVACLMMTNPNTLGIFEKDVQTIAKMLHEVDAQLYYDGANLNAICGVARPGDMGCDMMHFNLHKTFSTPHGGGGPGAGPIGVKEHLRPFLPVPRVTKKEGKFHLDSNQPDSIGRVRTFYGNYGLLLRGLVFMKALGGDGLPEMSKDAVLNANYLLALLKKAYDAPYGDRCMHEFVLTVSRQKREHGVGALDFAKRLLDYGYHAPTVYFPLIVPECLMIEPTESESKGTLDAFVDVMLKIAKEAETEPKLLQDAPVTTAVGRLDEATAARQPNLRWTPA
jgi:glycine dehydrogenase subunit 2